MKRIKSFLIDVLFGIGILYVTFAITNSGKALEIAEKLLGY